MSIAWIGIDPGADGAIALLYENYVEIHNLSVDPVLLHAQFEVWTMLYPEIFGMIEKQWPRPKNGVNNAFAMGGNYRQIQLLCSLSNIPLVEVAPTSWKTTMGLSSDKQLSVELALELYPDAPLKASKRARKDSHDRAEALLLAHLARETYGEELDIAQWRRGQ